MGRTRKGVPFVTGSDTSEAAAKSIEPKVTRLQAIVLKYIASQGKNGSTPEESQLATGLKHQSNSPRYGELRDKGLIVDTGTRRNTLSGGTAAIWVTPKFMPEKK